jgi:hypothetical protein
VKVTVEPDNVQTVPLLAGVSATGKPEVAVAVTV